MTPKRSEKRGKRGKRKFQGSTPKKNALNKQNVDREQTRKLVANEVDADNMDV
jgi:hypothetical protein